MTEQDQKQLGATLWGIAAPRWDEQSHCQSKSKSLSKSKSGTFMTGFSMI
jgi:hypothetical protein